MPGPLAWALAALGLLLLVEALRLRTRWQLRGFPCMPGYVPVFGQVLALRKGIHTQYERWARQYGGAFYFWMGKNPVVVLTDPDLIRQVAVKHFARFHDRPSFVSVPSSNNKRMVAIRSGLLVSRGGYWGSLRAAMNPLFHTAALASYVPTFNESASRLVERVEEAGKGGEQPFDVHALLGRMTMEVIGRTAFGVDFITGGCEEEDQAAGRPNLVAAVKAIFAAGAFAPGFGIGLLFRLLPACAEPLVFNIFFRAVGGLAKRLEYARSTVMSTADLLMQRAKRQALARGEAVTMVETDWRWWPDTFTENNPYKDAVPAAGSVLDMLLRAINKETGHGLTDVQIASQANTLIAAGYETSANALAFAVYCLATHPEAEARLVAEINACGAQEPSAADLHRFPYAEACLNEALRLYPPAHVTNREVTAVDGATLAAADGTPLHLPHGTWVHFAIWALHRSEQHWRQPLAYRPERFLDEEEVAARHPTAFIPFGLGPRMCIGFRFAQQETLVALIRLYQRFTLRLADRQQQQPLPLRVGITLSPGGAKRRCRHHEMKSFLLCALFAAAMIFAPVGVCPYVDGAVIHWSFWQQVNNVWDAVENAGGSVLSGEICDTGVDVGDVVEAAADVADALDGRPGLTSAAGRHGTTPALAAVLTLAFLIAAALLA
ncbi:cytochrome p450 [Micractinium conductrix]|uniref:Cytochrome p450 n=1 Tax=Micractinium conductrix TaxID=554055 RepID=A0A2P6V981_9CHLO|nr:cytochrome p450 [Micractinium conductrix]|eukprot:PSC70657.1 cytochrome p450 [Micractinium conductrix]